MTFLLDENLALSYAEALHDIGIDAIHVIDVGLDQTKGEDIVDFARNNNLAIITFDLDHTSGFRSECKHTEFHRLKRVSQRA